MKVGNERISIHNIVIAEGMAKNPAMFDSEKHIEKADWQRLQDYLGWNKRDIHIDRLGPILRSAKVISPDRFGALVFEKPNFEVEIRNDYDIFTCSYVFPELKQRVAADYVSQQVTNALLREPFLYERLLIGFMTHFPSRIDEVTSSDKFQAGLERILARSFSLRSAVDLAFMRIALSKEKFEPRHTTADWKIYLDNLSRARRGYTPIWGQPARYEEELDRFWNYAFCLKILAADRVTVADEGIILESTESVDFRVSPMPEIRRF